MIDFSPFAKALRQLELSLSYFNSEEARADPQRRKVFRSAVIKSFEYTYETATLMIKRQLAEIVTNPPELRSMPFMDLMRTAADAGLIRGAKPFHGYRQKRNITSHTYNEEEAEDVLTAIDPFLQDMRFLMTELERRNQ